MSKQQSFLNTLMPLSLLRPEERPPIPKVSLKSTRHSSISVFFQLLKILYNYTILCLLGRRKKSFTKRGERIIRALQQLGMLWIRVAQILFLRSAKVSSDFGLQILDTRDHGLAHSFDIIKNTFDKELGSSIESIFDIFEEKPFYATTVSQVYKARLRQEQVWVAVKIQQPDAEDTFNRDLKFLSRVFGFLKFFSIKAEMQWDNCFHELKEIKLRELNYYYEANALEQLRKNFIKQPIHVPKIFRRYCGSKILVMEYIKGALLSDIAYMRKKDPKRLQTWLQKNNVDLKIVARRLFHSVYRQVFENNFFHGDMHTANIIILRNNHMAVIECRSAGSHEIESLAKQKMFLRSLAQKEYVNAAEIYFLLATRLPRVDLGVVKGQLVRIWRIWETRVHVRDLPYEEKSLTYMNGEINRILYKSHFKPLWAFSKLTCTWVHLDNAISILSSDFNYIKQLCLYCREEQKRDTVSKILQLPFRIVSSLTALHEIPDRIADYSIFQENLIRRKALVVQSSVSKIDSVIAAGFSFATFFLMVTDIFFFLVFLKQLGNISLKPMLGSQFTWLASQIPVLGLGSWVGLLTLFTTLYFFFRNQKARFCKQDFGGDDLGKTETPSPEGRSY